MASVMPALASALHPLVDTSAGALWGHRLEHGLWSTQELRGGLLHVLPRPSMCSNPTGEVPSGGSQGLSCSVLWAQLPAAAAW